MYKRILFVVLLTMGLSGVSFADDSFDDGYGYDEVNDVSAGHQVGRGIYFGGQIGLSNLHYGSSQYTLPVNAYDEAYRMAVRGYVGYAFSQHISAEIGYDYYGRPKFKHNPTGNTQVITQQGMDFVMKASLPLDYGFALYVKGGLAWVHRSELNSNTDFFAKKDANNKYPLVGGLGVNYWFAPNMALDFCWTKISSVSDLPTSDIFALGLVYKINI